jgi:hypothetical protein
MIRRFTKEDFNIRRLHSPEILRGKITQISAEVLMSPVSKNKLFVKEGLPSPLRTDMALQETHDVLSCSV